MTLSTSTSDRSPFGLEEVLSYHLRHLSNLGEGGKDQMTYYVNILDHVYTSFMLTGL